MKCKGVRLLYHVATVKASGNVDNEGLIGRAREILLSRVVVVSAQLVPDGAHSVLKGTQRRRRSLGGGGGGGVL